MAFAQRRRRPVGSHNPSSLKADHGSNVSSSGGERAPSSWLRRTESSTDDPEETPATLCTGFGAVWCILDPFGPTLELSGIILVFFWRHHESFVRLQHYKMISGYRFLAFFTSKMVSNLRTFL